MMTQQEQFEADYLAAFPDDVGKQCLFCKLQGGAHIYTRVEGAFGIWLQQAKRHEAEIAELVAALKRIVDIPPAFIDGQFIVEHHDMDGVFLGAQPIDPVAVVQEMQSVAYGAIAKYGVRS